MPKKKEMNIINLKKKEMKTSNFFLVAIFIVSLSFSNSYFRKSNLHTVSNKTEIIENKNAINSIVKKANNYKQMPIIFQDNMMIIG